MQGGVHCAFICADKYSCFQIVEWSRAYTNQWIWPYLIGNSFGFSSVITSWTKFANLLHDNYQIFHFKLFSASHLLWGPKLRNTAPDFKISLIFVPCHIKGKCFIWYSCAYIGYLNKNGWSFIRWRGANLALAAMNCAEKTSDKNLCQW